MLTDLLLKICWKCSSSIDIRGFQALWHEQERLHEQGWIQQDHQTGRYFDYLYCSILRKSLRWAPHQHLSGFYWKREVMKYLIPQPGEGIISRNRRFLCCLLMSLFLFSSSAMALSLSLVELACPSWRDGGKVSQIRRQQKPWASSKLFLFAPSPNTYSSRTFPYHLVYWTY